jgi:hypothetical protein
MPRLRRSTHEDPRTRSSHHDRAERVAADIRRALTLREAGYVPVQHIPRADIA